MYTYHIVPCLKYSFSLVIFWLEMIDEYNNNLIPLQFNAYLHKREKELRCFSLNSLPESCPLHVHVCYILFERMHSLKPPSGHHVHYSIDLDFCTRVLETARAW